MKESEVEVFGAAVVPTDSTLTPPSVAADILPVENPQMEVRTEATKSEVVAPETETMTVDTPEQAQTASEATGSIVPTPLLVEKDNHFLERMRDRLSHADALLTERRTTAEAYEAKVKEVKARMAKVISLLEKRVSEACQAEHKLAQQQTELTLLQLQWEGERGKLKSSLDKSQKKLNKANQEKASLRDLLSKSK